jgi:hypothetical protein
MQPFPQTSRPHAMQLRRGNEIEPLVDHRSNASPHFRRNTPCSALRLTRSTGGYRVCNRHFKNHAGLGGALDTTQRRNCMLLLRCCWQRTMAEAPPKLFYLSFGLAWRGGIKL